jgi:APA family basic amino acid/polyamine antiporter
MALTFAAYVVPGPWQRPVGAAAVVALAAVNYRGVTRTARLTRVIVTVVLAVLAVVVLACLAGGQASLTHLTQPYAGPLGGWYGTLQSAGLLFFAFAGYARIATMGEEVRDPRRVIPRAVLLALAVAVAVYAVVGVSALLVLGPTRLGAAAAPLAAAVGAGGWSWAVPLVRIGGALASLGALLALIAGLGRTTLAMARERDLPGRLDAVHPRYRVPHRAEVAVAAVVVALVLAVDLRGAIGFSSFGVLTYYLVANLAALSQTGEWRRFPRWLQVVGALGCVVLVATLPLSAVVVGVAVFAAGVLVRLVTHRVRANRTTGS